MNATSNWLAPVLRNRMVMFILALAILTPLAFAPVSARNPALGAALLEGCAIVLLSMLLLRADWRGGLGKRVVEFSKSAANLPVLLFLAVAGASLLMTPNKTLGIQEFLRLGCGVVLYFAIAHHVRRSDQLSCLVDVLLFLCCAISIAGFVQFDSSTGTFATGLFGDHQLYGSVLMALLPVAAAVAVSEKGLARQLFARCATVLGAAGLLIAHSRSAWIGAAIALTLLVVVSVVQMARKQRSHVHLKLAEVVVPVVLLVIALGFFMVMWPHSTSLVQRASTLTEVKSDATWNARQVAWAGAEKMIAQSPLTGKGLGSLPYLQSNYSGVGLDIASLHLHPSLSNQAHNLYLQTAAEVGIPGLLLFLSIPITLLAIGVRRAMQMDDGIRKTLLLGAMAATVGCLVDAITSPSWQIGTVSVFMWLLMGIVASCMQPNARRERSASAELVAQPAARPVFAFAALGLSVLLPTAAMAASVGYDHVLSVRLVPATSTIADGGSQTYQLLATFGSGNGGPTTEEDVTANAKTTFTTTATASQGALTANVYKDVPGGSAYATTVTGKFTDNYNAVATASATLNVNGTTMSSGGGGSDDGAIIGGTIGGGLVLWYILTHLPHSTPPPTPPNTEKKKDTMLNPGINGYGTTLPDDSLFNTGPTSETGAAH